MDFDVAEFEIEEQSLIKGASSRIWKCALLGPEYDLKAILLNDRRDEATSSFQAKEIKKTAEPVHASKQQMKKILRNSTVTVEELSQIKKLAQ